MCQLWTGGRLLGSISKNYNLSKSLYVVLKKGQEGRMVIKLKIIEYIYIYIDIYTYIYIV